MVFFHNFLNQKQIDQSTILLSMRKFPIFSWIIIINVSILLTSGFLGASQEKIQSLGKTKLTLKLLLNYTPITVIIILLVLIFDLFVVFYRIKIYITKSEVIVYHMIRKFTFLTNHYSKSSFTLHIVRNYDIEVNQIPIENSTICKVKLKSFNSVITLITFKKNEIQKTKDYVLKLKENGIHLTKNVEELFQIQNKEHRKHYHNH